MEEARALGYYTDKTADILGIEKSADGRYPSVNMADINREIELYDNVVLPNLKKELELKQKYSRDEYDYKLSTSFFDSIIKEAYKRTGKLPDTTNYFEVVDWAMGVMAK